MLNLREDRTMTNKFTDAQVALLRSVFQRVIAWMVVLREKVDGARALAAKLIDAPRPKAVKTKLEAPVTRTVKAREPDRSRKTTTAGLKAFSPNEVRDFSTHPTARGCRKIEGRKEASPFKADAQEANTGQSNLREGRSDQDASNGRRRHDGRDWWMSFNGYRIFTHERLPGLRGCAPQDAVQAYGRPYHCDG